jgi:hypothetical protein
MHLNVHRFRQVTKPFAFRVFRWGVWAGMASAVFCVVTSGAFRAWGVRAFGICFAMTVSGFLIHFALVTMDEWRKRDYLTCVWMFFWTLLQAFIIFIGVRVAVFGLHAHAG